MAAVNNLHERLKAIEKRPDVETVSNGNGNLTVQDRAVLDEAARFLGVHGIVANTVESRKAGISDIDPNTGLERVIVERPNFQKVELAQTGS